MDPIIHTLIAVGLLAAFYYVGRGYGFKYGYKKGFDEGATDAIETMVEVIDKQYGIELDIDLKIVDEKD